MAGLESRGFLLLPLALEMGLPFVCLRKAGKLPGAVHRVDYALEYGNASLELASNPGLAGARVLLVDDLLATGGTAGTSDGVKAVADMPGKEALLALILAPAQNLLYLLSNYATKLEEGAEQG